MLRVMLVVVGTIGLLFGLCVMYSEHISTTTWVEGFALALMGLSAVLMGVFKPWR